VTQAIVIETFFDERPLHNATTQEAADCLNFIEELRVLRKLGGYGRINVTVERGDCIAFEVIRRRHIKGT